MQGLQKAISQDAKFLKVYGDSEIVIKKVRNDIHCFSNHLKHYQYLVQYSTSHFLWFEISPIPRLQNVSADLLANVASKLIPPWDFSPDRFTIELIFHPFIPDNITNYKGFNDDADIISFLTSKGTCNEQIIDEDIHDKELNKSYREEGIENEFPK